MLKRDLENGTARFAQDAKDATKNLAPAGKMQEPKDSRPIGSGWEQESNNETTFLKAALSLLSKMLFLASPVS
jgi:hypothetical protein